ncbi:hypothetical protein D3C77_567500 [compost metagenome]
MALLFDISQEITSYESHGLAISTLMRAKAAIGIAFNESQFDGCGYSIPSIAGNGVFIGEGKVVSLPADIYSKGSAEDDGHILS